MMYTEVKPAKKRFCESLREHAMEINNFKKKNEVINKQIAEIICK